MAGFRYRNDDDVFFNDDGTVCAGGSLTYTRSGTSTAHVVFTDPDLDTSLGNVITLDASGRAPDHWLDDSTYEYRVVLKNSAGVQQGDTRDNVRGQDSSGIDVPDPADADDGQVLASNGTTLEYITIIQVPDPTGHSNKQLGTDGEAVFWEEKPEAFSSDNLPGGIEVGDNHIQIGTKLDQWGTGSAATNGTDNVTAAVTFTPAFDSAPVVVITPTIANVNNAGWIVQPASLNVTASGFTANFKANGEDLAMSETIDSAVTFAWRAVGTRDPS